MKRDADKAFEQALHFLKYSDRTVHEMKDKLREKGFSDEAVDNSVERLKRLGLIDDAKFAERWIRAKLRSRPIGRKMIQTQLRLKGIHPDLIAEKIETVYHEFEMSDILDQLVRKQMAKHRSIERFELKRKVFSFLLRRGFDYEECTSAVERAISDADDN